jgi:gluconokinase
METLAPPRANAPRSEEWILVLDVGSSSARAWLYDRAGRGLDPGPDAQRFYAWRDEPAGAMEQDAELILERVVAAVDAALAHARAAELRISAVAVAVFWHSLLGLDARGEPVTPVLAWGDTRAWRAALQLREGVDERALHRRTGCYLHPSFPLVKLHWLKRTDPEAFGRAAAWASFPEFLEQRLFGRRRCSFSMASGTGLLDVHRLRWDPEALEVAGIRPDMLSELVDADAPIRGLLPELAGRWPELAGVDWYPALGDGACANLGSGAVGLDRIGVTIGTSAAARALWEPAGEVEIPDRLWCYRLDRRRWVAGGALSNGGNAIAFLRDFLEVPPERELEERLAELEPDGHGLTILPFLVGERGPGWALETQSVVAGLRPSTPPEHLVRAWMEAVTFRLAGVCSELERVLGREPRVMASGGALHASPVWAQVLADVLNRPVSLPVEREATARGAALVVQAHLGWVGSLDETAPDEAVRFEPRAAPHRRYREARERQASLEAALAPWLSLAPPSAGERGGS